MIPKQLRIDLFMLTGGKTAFGVEQTDETFEVG
jgi:hypothetical protein